MQGFVQLLTWGKILQQLNTAFDIADPTDAQTIPANATSLYVANYLNSSVQTFFQSYQPKIPGTLDLVNDAIKNITMIPDSFWTPFSALTNQPSNAELTVPPSLQSGYDILLNSTICTG